MTRILDVQAPELTIVFGRTKRRVDELSKGLEARGYNAAGIHGDLTQQRRMNILKKFKEGRLDILVATDVAARDWTFPVLLTFITMIFPKTLKATFTVSDVPVVPVITAFP